MVSALARCGASLLALSLLVAGCASVRPQETQDAKGQSRSVNLDKAEKKPGPVSDLSYPESFDRGIARLLAMGLNGVEGVGRDMDEDGLITGLVPAVANLLTEGIVGDLFIDGLGGSVLYLSGSDEVARQARLRAARTALRTHLSFIPGPEGTANIVETDYGYSGAQHKYVDQGYPINLDQSFGSLVGMPFGLVRQIGRNFDDNGFVVGLVELIPNLFVATVAEVGGGLGKFGTLLVGQAAAAESIDRWQQDLESNNKLITGH